MRCQKAKGYISQGMDEQLPPAVTVKLTEHLDACAACRGYREELLLGQRAIAATTPRLPDNFDWKLQLKLNQTLQRTAGETAYPWDADTDQDKWTWFRNFGAAAAMGMAAVLALAVFLGPNDGLREPGLTASGGSAVTVAHSVSRGASDADRRPLFVDRSQGGGLYGAGIQRPVSTGGTYRSGGHGLFDSRWSGHNYEDLRTIQRLQIQNGQLNRDLYLQQQIILRIRTQLDTTAVKPLDLEQE